MQAGCALIGGETAEMPGMYEDGEYDIAGFTVGIVDKKKSSTARRIQPGDAVIGLASSGIHSQRIFARAQAAAGATRLCARRIMCRSL